MRPPPFSTCAWCDNEAVHMVLVQEARYETIPGTAEKLPSGKRGKPADKELKQMPIRVPACVEHQDITLGQAPPVKTPRNTTARDVPQLTIYDVPGVDPGGGPTMSPFDPDRWKSGAQQTNQPPPPATYEISVQDAGAFVAESSGKELGKIEVRALTGPEEGRQWVVWLNLDNDFGQDMAIQQCTAMGLDTSGIQTLEDLDQLLRTAIGEYYEVKIQQKGQYRNTWFQGPITQTAPKSDVTNGDQAAADFPTPEEAQQKIGEAQQAAGATKAADDDQPPF